MIRRQGRSIGKESLQVLHSSSVIFAISASPFGVFTCFTRFVKSAPTTGWLLIFRFRPSSDLLPHSHRIARPAAVDTSGRPNSFSTIRTAGNVIWAWSLLASSDNFRTNSESCRHHCISLDLEQNFRRNNRHFLSCLTFLSSRFLPLPRSLCVFACRLPAFRQVG